MSVTVRLVVPFDGIPEQVVHSEGIIAQPDEQNNLIVWANGDVRVATYHRDHWVSARVEKIEESE